MLYYEHVFPSVVNRFDAQIQSLPTLPPIMPAQQDVVQGCTPTREVDDLWTGFLYAAEFVGQPLCVAAAFFRNIVAQTKADNITQVCVQVCVLHLRLTLECQVENLLESAFGCDIYSIQTCSTRRNFIYSLAIWAGLYGALTVFISIWAPFLLMPTITLTLLFLPLMLWWTYRCACLRVCMFYCATKPLSTVWHPTACRLFPPVCGTVRSVLCAVCCTTGVSCDMQTCLICSAP